MCGRYVVAYDPATLVDGFSLTRIDPFPKRWNVAPTTDVPVIHDTREGERVGTLMRWGLVPHWAKDITIGAKLNNARSESMTEKPSFRQAVRKRRCLIPASGFYEWQPRRDARGKVIKQPWYFSPTDEPWFAFAGLFEAWRPAPPPNTAQNEAEAPWLLTCTIITREANAVMAPVHDRMPVIIPRTHWAEWLRRDLQDVDALPPLMPPTPPEAIQAWPVSRAVSKATNEGEALVDAAEPEGTLVESAPPSAD